MEYHVSYNRDLDPTELLCQACDVSMLRLHGCRGTPGHSASAVNKTSQSLIADEASGSTRHQSSRRKKGGGEGGVPPPYHLRNASHVVAKPCLA